MRKMRTRRQTWGLVGRYTLLSVLSIIVLFPIYITIVNGLLTVDQVGAKPPILFPLDPAWENFERAWSNGHFGHYMLNSFIVTAIIVVGQLVTAIFAGYAFAFLEFPFKRTLFVVFLATLMVPFEVTIIQNLTTVSDLGLYNSYAGLAIPFLATGFGAFLMRQAFLGVPRDLQDAASLDGYGHWRFMSRVAVPLVRPSIAALGVFAFLSAWNQYLWPLLVTKDDEFRTVQVGLKQLAGSTIGDIPIRFASAAIAVVPLAILLIVFQKQLVRGLTAGAVKG
jgi:sn-glycerol 3-phosphate transport system permease protein